MLPDSVTVAVIAGISTLSGVAFTSLMQSITAQRNQRFELRRESVRIEHEISEKRAWLMREKLEKAHIILSEISREFSLTFLTIDWSAKMPPVDFHNKYRNLCFKADEVQMIVDLYAPSISEPVEDLYGLMNCYWGYFHVVLIMEQKGEKVDHTTPSYLEAVKYAQKIPSKVYNIKYQIGTMVHLTNYEEMKTW